MWVHLWLQDLKTDSRKMHLLRELARLGTKRAGGPGLTSAERQVADLVAAGRTNREVASDLYMGMRTVEAHLSSIYRKLGVRSRMQVAAEAGRLGIDVVSAPGSATRALSAAPQIR